jgi:N-acetylglutamate synthase-like GNAT family acetyltransferase/catechol 2,3-dioxygenase-like lactoylglutathione lyase family enzyme
MASSDRDGIRTLKAHVALNVRDVEMSVEFYRRVFGIEPSKHRPRYAKFDVESPPLNLTLNERPFADSGALFHMGIQVASTADVLKMRERWKAAGFETREEMGIVCGYALQDKSWVTDPDGNQWEVFVVHKDNLPTYYGEGDKCGASSPSSCSTEAASASSSCGCTGATEITRVESGDVNISGASPSDLDDILALLTAVSLPHEGVREYLESFLVMRDAEGRLVGCAGLERHGGVGLLRSVAVAPELQKAGVGSRLTAAAIEYAAAYGVKEVVLLTTTARDFFARRFGFADAKRADYENRLARSPEWRLPRCSSAAFMRLDLTAHATTA